jgi:hypothetical protein
MAILSGSMSFAEAAKRTDPSGRAAKIVEILDQSNEITSDAPSMEGNMEIGHQISTRTSIPAPTWIGPNTGISSTSSAVGQDIEPIGLLANKSLVDVHVANFGGNLQANLLSESKAVLEGMAQEMAGTLIYGNQTTAPQEFDGLAPRFNSLTGTTGENIINGGGSDSDNTSIWLVGWGDRKVNLRFPRGSKAGLEQMNRGIVDVTTTAGSGDAGATYPAYMTYFYWRVGLCVEDWRYVSRGCNIDVSSLRAKSSAADLIEMMIRMTHRIPNLKACMPRFYMNRTVLEQLDIQERDDVQTGGGLTFSNVDGERKIAFRGIPIRTVDQITLAEATIS